jgi:hypothetical protein
MVTDTAGTVVNVTFTGCLFWGTDSYAAWPNNPGFKFDDCTFYGSIGEVWGSSVADNATQFTDCRFEDLVGGTYPVWRGASALIPCQGQNVKFDNCTITANQIKALVMDNTSDQEILRNCDVYHKNNALVNGDYQSSLRGTLVRNTRFHESLASGQYYIRAESVSVGYGVTVDGPYVKWGDWISGLTGTIPPTMLIGDLNSDGHVDAADLNILANYYNTNNEQADINDSGLVDDTDLGILAANYGKSN